MHSELVGSVVRCSVGPGGRIVVAARIDIVPGEDHVSAGEQGLVQGGQEGRVRVTYSGIHTNFTSGSRAVEFALHR